jgi:capsular polysaccharide biosynthesis protein
MELRTYWQVLRRRWPLVLIPALIVLAIGLLTYRAPVPGYSAGVRFIVGQPPTPSTDLEDEERYYNWLTSEYIVNGLTDWVRGGAFATAVSQDLAQRGVQVPAAAIQGGLAADNARSMLTISVVGNSTPTVAEIMDSVIAVLTTQNAEALPQLGGETALLTQLDQPVVNQVPTGIRDQLELPVRLLLALAAGVGLALLVEYLDPTIRARDEVQELGLGVLAEIPRK